MDPAVLSVLGVGFALAAIVLSGQRAMRAAFRAEMGGLVAGISGLRSELQSLPERVARIEGQLAGPARFLESPPPTSGGRAA